MGALRILHVTPYYEDAWAYGGVPRAVSALARAQSRSGHQVTVATTDVQDRAHRLPSITRSEPGTPTVHVFRNASNRLAYDLQLFLPVGLRAFLRDQAGSFDAIHAHAFHNVPTVLAGRAASQAKRPFLLQPHGTARLIERRRLAKWAFDRTVGNGLSRHVTRWLALTEIERRELIALGVSETAIRVVPAPVESEDVPTNADLAGPNRIAYLGRLSPRKRVDLLIEAFAMLPEPVQLAIAGPDMGVERELRAMVRRRGLDQRVRFVGALEGRARIELLSNAQVVAYPAEDEALGLVPLEALLCGTPVVVAGDSGCGATISRLGGGIVLREPTSGALAEALGTILSSPSVWRERARAAGGSVRAEFGPEAVARQMDAVLAEVVAP